ncbi:MAG: sodium:proton antiporter [Oscillospiraceae bacterium]|nr:sodium:proton antiporter [Oscillospiraceae bacterium]MBR5306849.1 sodium:proton antiporter [Oscillospiraceae bacterium]
MAETVYNGFTIVAMVVLALVVFGYFVRTVLGPHFADRIVAVNSISTIVMLFISFVAVMQGENYIVDIAIIYAVLGFVTVIILCKSYLRSHKKDRANDLKNLKEEVNKK